MSAESQKITLNHVFQEWLVVFRDQLENKKPFGLNDGNSAEILNQVKNIFEIESKRAGFDFNKSIFNIVNEVAWGCSRDDESFPELTVEQCVGLAKQAVQIAERLDEERIRESTDLMDNIKTVLDYEINPEASLPEDYRGSSRK